MLLFTRKVTLCVGHYKKSQGYKMKALNLSEWSVNRLFIESLARALKNNKYDVHTVLDLNLIRKVKRINEVNMDIAIDLHCNAYNGEVSGHEVLYWHESRPGGLLADCICGTINLNINRKAVPIINQPGTYFLKNTKPVAIILESCFLDNKLDALTIGSQLETLALQVAEGINAFHILYNVISNKPQFFK